MSHAQKTRRKRLQKMEKEIAKDETVEKSEVIAMSSYHWGLSRRTSKEYIETLNDLGKIEIEEKEDKNVIEYVGDLEVD